MNKRRLFASAMAACMLLSTMPSTALAADTSPDATIVSNAEDSTTDPSNSNEINWTQVNNLEELQKATTDQGKINIKLGDNIESDKRVLTVTDGQDITLDLNGHTITSKGEYTISVENAANPGEGWFGGKHTETGTLTIIGEGTIENTNDRSSTIRNYGTLTIGQKGATKFPTIIRTDITNPNNSAVKCEEESTLTIWGGTFEGNKRSVQNFGTTNIYGGTFKDSVEAWKYKDGTKTYDSTLTIYGGEFEGEVESANIENDKNYGEKGTLTISGGTFTADPTQYLASTDYMVKGSEGNYEVVNVVAMIGNTSYASLQDAVDAALNAGATTTEPVYIYVMAGAAIPEATVNKVGTFIVIGKPSITAGSSVNMTTTQVDKGVQYTFTAKPTTPSYDYDYDYTPPVSSGSNTTTQKNPDGSTTTTKTDKDGTVTETTKHTDGSTSTVETAKDGTVTTTEKDAKGNKTETVEKTDGTKEFTAKQKDGSEATASVDRNGAVKAEVELTQKALNNAATNNEAVTLPIPAISVDKFSAASTITVDLPDNTGKTSVVVPMEEMTPGSVVVMVLPDGTEKVVIATKTVEEGLAVELDGDCTFKVVDNSKDFADVKPGDWFSDATDFVSSRELFAGTSETEFSPNAEMTMEMLFAVAHNFMGKPERTGTNDIAGAKPEDWFHTASNWAAEIGLTNGLKMDMLGSNLPISREDTAILLYNLAGVDYTPSEEALSKLNSFSDIADMDPDNLTALAWVVENGIMNGMGDGTFGFKGNNTRAQTGAIMMNFNNNL